MFCSDFSLKIDSLSPTRLLGFLSGVRGLEPLHGYNRNLYLTATPSHLYVGPPVVSSVGISVVKLLCFCGQGLAPGPSQPVPSMA